MWSRHLPCTLSVKRCTTYEANCAGDGDGANSHLSQGNVAQELFLVNDGCGLQQLVNAKNTKCAKLFQRLQRRPAHDRNLGERAGHEKAKQKKDG